MKPGNFSLQQMEIIAENLNKPKGSVVQPRLKAKGTKHSYFWVNTVEESVESW